MPAKKKVEVEVTDEALAQESDIFGGDEVAPVVVEAVEASAGDTQVFGNAAVEVEKEGAQQMVNIPFDMLRNMQSQIAALQARDLDDGVVDPLAADNRRKIITATFYRVKDESGEERELLITGMQERVFANGTKSFVWANGLDADKKPMYAAILKAVDIENMQEQNIEVDYDHFQKNCTGVQVEAMKVNESLVDLTPREESVEISSYQERGGYVTRVGSGTMVRTSVQGKVQNFDVTFNNHTFNIASDVVNLKQA